MCHVFSSQIQIFQVEPLGHGSVLGPANMRTFRSDGVMLSSVQNYKVILSF